MKRILKIITVISILLLLVSCSLLPNMDKPVEKDEGTHRDKYKVSLVYSEGITYEGKNPLLVSKGESVSFEISLAPTHLISNVENASYDPLTRIITVDSVTSDLRIRATADAVEYDTSARYDYYFAGSELDETSIESRKEIYAGTEITVEAGNLDLIFRGWSLGDYYENGADIISEERSFSFTLTDKMTANGLCALYPNYSGRETNVLYYDLNGGSVNTKSRNMTNTASYTAELDGDYVKVTLGEKYYENVGACACIFWDDGTFYRDGYVLAEFNTKPDGSGEGYGSGCKFSLKNGISILYCIWKENTDPSLFTYEDCYIPRPSGVKSSNAPDWHENGIRITKYLGDESEVVVPETIDGKPVISIARKAFSHVSTGTVVLSRFILEIQDGAFEKLFHLNTIYYPDSVYYVSDNILDVYTQESLKHLYVNATMAPRGTASSDYAHKFARFLANADKNRVVLMSGSSGLYGFSGGYLEALLDEEYCVVNFGMVMSVNTQFALALTSYYGHEGDVLLYCPEASIRNCGTPHIYWKGIAYIEGMYNVFRVIDMSMYKNIFNSFAEVNQGSADAGQAKYKKTPSTYESRIENQNTYCEADTANRYYLNDGKHHEIWSPNITGGRTFSLKWQNPDMGSKEYAYVTSEPYTTNINALIGIAHGNGVKVYFGFAPINDHSVALSIRKNLDEVIAAYESGIMEAFDFDGLLGTAKDYIFNNIYFYDSGYHPNNYGKTYRTYQVYVDLCEKLGITDVNGYYDVGTKDDFFATLFEEGVVDGKPLIAPELDP